MTRDKLEYVNCNLCGGDNFRKFYVVKAKSKYSYPYPLRYVKCNNCSLVYTNPRPNFKKIKEQYESRFYHPKIPGTPPAYLKGILEANFNKLTFIEEYKKGGRLLDVGCASGIVLYLARLKGWEVYGAEIAKITADVAKNELKLNVFNGALENAHYKNDFFDVVCSFNTIEHLNDPYSFLCECHRLVKKDGILIVQTALIDALPFLILGKKWGPAAEPSQHLYLFTRTTLSRMIEKAGFKIIDIRQMPSWTGLKTYIRGDLSMSAIKNPLNSLFGLFLTLLSKIVRREALTAFVCVKK